MNRTELLNLRSKLAQFSSFHVNVPLGYTEAYFIVKLECGPMPNVMAALPNIGGALWSTPQSLADAQYWNAVQ